MDFFTFRNKKQIGRLRKNARKYDIIYLASATTFSKLKIKHPKILASVTSWKILEMGGKRIKNILRAPYAVSVNNLGLYEVLKKYRSDLFYLPNCVDTVVFSPSSTVAKPRRSVVIGWTGNVDRKEKNFKGLLSPIMHRVGGIASFSLIKTKKGSAKRLKYKTKEDMSKYYNGLDFYLNVSSSEGTPNPCLEAASCGIPIISTSVGNMPDLIIEGVNGYFLKPYIKSSVKKIVKIASGVDDNKYRSLSKNIRSRIIKGWSIDSRKKLIISFFGS